MASVLNCRAAESEYSKRLRLRVRFDCGPTRRIPSQKEPCDAAIFFDFLLDQIQKGGTAMQHTGAGHFAQAWVPRGVRHLGAETSDGRNESAPEADRQELLARREREGVILGCTRRHSLLSL